MDYEALAKKYQELLTNFTVLRVDAINHRPHPFTVGPKHVSHASKYHSGLLGQATRKAIPCAARGCGLPFDQHRFDVVVFIQLRGNLKRDAAQAELKPVAELMQEDRVDGFVFVETDENFRIED